MSQIRGLNIGIIMDGNGRWAKKNHLPRRLGHKKGAEVFTDIVKYCNAEGVNSVTFYAFSTENWKRSEDEIQGIMKLFKEYLIKAFDYEKENNRVIFIGQRDVLSKDLVDMMQKIEDGSRDKTGMTLYVAVNYGARAEIVYSAKRIAEMVKAGDIDIDDIDEQIISNNLYTKDAPDMDFILRPSGEQRISNFLLWQCAYSEFIFMDVLWPDFTPKHLDIAAEEFHTRDRRFGGRK